MTKTEKLQQENLKLKERLKNSKSEILHLTDLFEREFSRNLTKSRQFGKTSLQKQFEAFLEEKSNEKA